MTRKVIVRDSVLSRVCYETPVDAAGVVGTVGLADGGHSEYSTWHTL